MTGFIEKLWQVCDSEIDMMLLMDGSGSVGNKGFGKEKKCAISAELLSDPSTETLIRGSWVFGALVREFSICVLILFDVC